MRQAQQGWTGIVAETAAIAVAMLLGCRFPFSGLGWLEAVFSTLAIFLLMAFSLRGRRLGSRPA